MPMCNRLMRSVRFWMAFIVCAALSGSVRAGTPPKDLVKAELVTEVASVKPGEPFSAGVLLKMKPHWHVYWKNPGDSGMATGVQWRLPEGFVAGPLAFP